MAAEFGVKFLGRVPVDTQWGMLVEEGRRPSYGTVGVRDEEGEMDDEANGENAGGETAEPNEVSALDKEALLVDKYRDCSLCGVFGEITRELVGIVEGNGNSGNGVV